MTAQSTPQNDSRPFKTAAEVKREAPARTEQTDAEIKEWVREQIRADKKILDLLATL